MKTLIAASIFLVALKLAGTLTASNVGIKVESFDSYNTKLNIAKEQLCKM